MGDLEKEIIIAVMGATGSGKSYFIREVTGISDIEVTNGLHSCTMDIQSYSFPYTGVKITLVDTPGFNDTARSGIQVLVELSAWISSSYKKGKLLSGIIYLHNINDVRIDGSPMKYMKMFQRLCGPDALQKVLLTTTQWSNIDPRLGRQREEKFRNGDFWGSLIQKGATLKRFMGIKESGLELIDVLLQSGREWRPPPTDGTESEIVIAVMGVTGAGKSHFIREVTSNSDVKVSSGLRACTTEVQPYSFPYTGVKITLVDTPGFNDITKSDAQVLVELSAWMSSNYKKGKLLSGIIYLQNINDIRMSGPSVKCVKMFQRLCGPDALQNVLLTTTQWSYVDQGLGERYEGELRSGDFWGGLIREGASVKRFMGTRESGLELIDKLIKKEPKPATAWAEGDTGKFTKAEFISLQKRFQKGLEDLKREFQEDLEDIKREFQEAINQKDDILMEILAKDLDKALENWKRSWPRRNRW